jgi:hypothetical protein
MDPHSHAEPHRVRVTHVDLDLELDFTARVVRGVARLDLERADPGAPLVLDQQGLSIQRVTGDDGTARHFRVGTEHDGRGSALTIELDPIDRSVRVAYATTEKADALQWLEPSQTPGEVAVPVHAGPGRVDAHLDPAAGHAERARDVRRARARAGRVDRADERAAAGPGHAGAFRSGSTTRYLRT